MQTERARPYPLYVEPLKSLPLVLISLFIVVAAVDVLLALQPGLLQSLRAYWSAPAAGGTTSSALAAASVIVGGVALAATVLGAFIRGVRSAPYLCITPVWVCACMLAIARVQTPLPLPVPTAAFVAISALLFVGSGVLFESTSRLSNLIGTGASLLPLTLLSIGYAFNSDAQASFNGDSMLMLFVLALAGSGAPAIAVACRANGTRVLGGQSVVPEAAGAQMVALLERARLSEERAARAEHQLAAGGSLQPNAPRLALDDEELALTQPRGGSGWFGWAAAAVVLAIMVAWYAFGYAPLRGELANAEQASAKQAEEHAAALASLRRDFERKRTDLEQQLAAAAQPAAAQPAIAAPSPKASPRAVAVPQDVASDAARDDVSDASAEREARAQARRDARVAKREQAAAARAERTAEHDANLAAAKEEREAARQARAAEHEQKVAERHARVTERAEARASEREAKATERAEPKTTERADPKTGEKVERSAAAAATAALEAQAYGADTSKSSKRAAEKPAPVPAAPKKSAADVDDESSNDPLEGL